jgi:hypothetical protein
MKLLHFACGILALSLTSTWPAQADPKPPGARATDAQTLANLYAGKSQLWNSCKGGIYYGGQWQAQAFCSKDGESVGLGEWSVTRRGEVCHELTWYWSAGDGVGSKKDAKDCISHVTDPQGVIWRKFENDADWWKVENSKSFVEGFKMKSKVSKMRRKVSL